MPPTLIQMVGISICFMLLPKSTQGMVKPQEGSQRSLIEKISTSVTASQNTGVAMPMLARNTNGTSQPSRKIIMARQARATAMPT